MGRAIVASASGASPGVDRRAAAGGVRSGSPFERLRRKKLEAARQFDYGALADIVYGGCGFGTRWLRDIGESKRTFAIEKPVLPLAAAPLDRANVFRGAARLFGRSDLPEFPPAIAVWTTKPIPHAGTKSKLTARRDQETGPSQRRAARSPVSEGVTVTLLNPEADRLEHETALTGGVDRRG